MATYAAMEHTFPNHWPDHPKFVSYGPGNIINLTLIPRFLSDWERGYVNFVRIGQCTILFFCRSKNFWPSFARLAEVHSLILPGTLCMACTTTATKGVRKEVGQSLEMSTCVGVSVSPDRPNIFYEVKHCIDLESDC